MLKNLSLGFSIVSIVVLVAAVLAEGSTGAELTKQAKITKVQAQEIALAKVSHGVVKSAEIEKEKGRLVWSFDIAQARTKDITEILVDAQTGRIISRQTESPRDQAKEAAAHKQQR